MYSERRDGRGGGGGGGGETKEIYMCVRGEQGINTYNVCVCVCGGTKELVRVCRGTKKLMCVCVCVCEGSRN